MSFQRMLMIATREVRPYLPHPEALVCLYLPRWQTEHGNTLTDWSGNYYNIALTSGSIGWNDDGSISLIASSAMSVTIAQRNDEKFTILAERGALRTNNYYTGFYVRQSTTSRHLLELKRPTGYMVISCTGNANVVAPPTSGWVWMRKSDYMHQPITPGHDLNYNTIYLGRGVGSSGCLWTSFSCGAIWSIHLTDEEIEMAKLFLSTASLEDYMMSRL